MVKQFAFSTTDYDFSLLRSNTYGVIKYTNPLTMLYFGLSKPPLQTFSFSDL